MGFSLLTRTAASSAQGCEFESSVGTVVVVCTMQVTSLPLLQPLWQGIQTSHICPTQIGYTDHTLLALLLTLVFCLLLPAQPHLPHRLLHVHRLPGGCAPLQ